MYLHRQVIVVFTGNVNKKNRQMVAVCISFFNLSRNSLKKCYFIASSTLKIKCGKSEGMQEKVSIMGVDRRIHHSGSLFGITRLISDPHDRFFYPHYTPMKDTYMNKVYQDEHEQF